LEALDETFVPVVLLFVAMIFSYVIDYLAYRILQPELLHNAPGAMRPIGEGP
jgi:hypothetical protein